jgi:hypothetical protein
MKLTKKTIYIGLFAILYLIVAFSSFFHACAFFGLANNSWMSIILAFAFEVGQAAVLFSLLTSSKDRGRIMPWVLMTMFTLVQVIGNVYSSYKYIITNSVENLRYFKEPIFIWTELPDAQANVIIVYLVGALLPIAALLLTSMITNYLTDQSGDEFSGKESLNEQHEIENLNVTIDKKDEEIEQLKKQLKDFEENPLINEHSILQMENQGLEESNKKKDEEIEQLRKQLEDAKKNTVEENETKQEVSSTESTVDNKSDNTEKQSMETKDQQETIETVDKDSKSEVEELHSESNENTSTEISAESTVNNEVKKPSHFINL